MTTFIGTIFDVSGSMKSNIENEIDDEGGIWANMTFKVIDDLIKYDVSSTNMVFGIGVGAQGHVGIIDVINTIKESLKDETATGIMPAKHRTIENILLILEANGARNVRQWAQKDVISEAVSEKLAVKMLNKLRNNQEFATYFVYDCLPTICRNLIDPSTQSRFDGFQAIIGKIGKPKATEAAANFFSFLQTSANTLQDVVTEKVTPHVQASKEDVEKVIDRAHSFLSIFTVQEASELLHGIVGKELTPARSRELFTKIEPFIYGLTPLHAAINLASTLFKKSTSTHPKHQKLFFILSDGEPTDVEVSITKAKKHLKDADVKVVGCFISRTSTIEPRRLYGKSQRGWCKGAKFLFDLSSTVPTELITRAIFIKRGWTIDIDDNETKLFLHVNHPENLQDACDLARSVVCCQDALSELLVSIDLDQYINQKNQSVKAHNQVGGTCYANAAATVLHLAMQRVLGRNVPDFEVLREEMISIYGTKGAYTDHVLRAMCQKYRLRYRKVCDVKEAMTAITEKRLVVATFSLTDDEWNSFGDYFRLNPNCVLRKQNLDISTRPLNAITKGHAVVLTSYNSECLRLMNSWGEKWADNGFFKVEKAEVLELEFFDVYWHMEDLTKEEQKRYRDHGSEVAMKLMNSLKTLQKAMFECPLCNLSSLVSEFKGTLCRAICPKCSCEFSSIDGKGNILALNMHLTSLSGSSTVPKQ